MSTKAHKKVRLYTTVLSFTDENAEFRKNLIQYFNAKMNQASNSSSARAELQAPSAVSQNLPLIIKRYDFPNTLSAEIHHSNPNEKFEIQGPIVI